MQLRRCPARRIILTCWSECKTGQGFAVPAPKPGIAHAWAVHARDPPLTEARVVLRSIIDYG